MRTWCTAILLAMTAIGCGNDPADVAGSYSISLTYRENGCMISGWTQDDVETGIPVTITQDGANASATVGGFAGGVLNVWLGSNVYQGEVSGSSMELTIFGTNSVSAGNCTYTMNSTIDASLSGDVLSGDIFYRVATNGSPDCGPLEGCVSRQEFNGTRPPQ